MLGLVHYLHKVSSSWRLPLNWVRISACWTKQEALRRDNRQEGLLNSLEWMLVVPHDGKEDG